MCEYELLEAHGGAGLPQDSRSVQEDDLEVVLRVQADNAMARRLSLCCHDGQLLPQYAIQQGTLPCVWFPDYCNISCRHMLRVLIWHMKAPAL